MMKLELIDEISNVNVKSFDLDIELHDVIKKIKEVELELAKIQLEYIKFESDRVNIKGLNKKQEEIFSNAIDILSYDLFKIFKSFDSIPKDEIEVSEDNIEDYVIFRYFKLKNIFRQRDKLRDELNHLEEIKKEIQQKDKFNSDEKHELEDLLKKKFEED